MCLYSLTVTTAGCSSVCLRKLSARIYPYLVHKPFTALLLNGKIVERTFSTDVTITKKAKEGADQTIQSLKKQCDPYGWMKITCGTADVFGLAEVKLVLEAFDKDASSLGDDDDYENVDRTFASTSVPGQVFRYDVKFRADRTLSCRMHALQNVFQPLLKACLNIQGLSNSATTAQNSATIQLNPPCCQPIQQSETYQHPISNPT